MEHLIYLPSHLYMDMNWAQIVHYFFYNSAKVLKGKCMFFYMNPKYEIVLVFVKLIFIDI